MPYLLALFIFLLCLPGKAATGSIDGLLGTRLPQGIELEWSRIQDGILEVCLRGDLQILRPDERREELVKTLFWTGQGLEPISGIRIFWKTERGPQLLNRLLQNPDEERLIKELIGRRPPRAIRLPPLDLPLGGSLGGRHIVLSPGHGFIYYDTLQNWSTQRGLINISGCESCTGIIEDFSNAEIALRYLVPDLLRAGATVWLVRESDFSTFEKIVDDGDADYQEEGSWRDGTSPGGYGGDYRVLLASDGGRAIYRFAAPRPGEYWLSLWTVAGSNRITDMRVSVEHGAEHTTLNVDLTANGSRWRELGRFYLQTDYPLVVTLEPGPRAEPDGYLVADAVRLGGGIDNSEVGGKISNKPRWQMGALYFLPYLGLPSSANTGSDVTVRPAYAEWQGADAYVSLHSNASGGSTTSASGTSTYRFSCYDFPDHSPAPDPSQCDDPPGSDRLLRAVHSSIIQTLRQRWDPLWCDRGTLVANFGELRPLESMPGILIESAFHDGVEKAAADMRMPDNEALQDPRFRRLLAWSIYAGLSKFFDPQAVLLPVDPPQGLWVIHHPQGGLEVGWQEVEGAELYRVSYSIGGRSVIRSLLASEPRVRIQDLQPGEIVALQVSAINAGGEGPPSELAACRYRGHGALADILLVNGFDRQDARIGDGRNRRDQAWDYAWQIYRFSDRRLYVDFSSNEAVADGSVSLASYRAVIWLLGEESATDETFSAAEQARLSAYLESGGALLASGAEIGWDLVEQGSAEDKLFFENTFAARFAGDDADTFSAEGSGPLLLAGRVVFDDGSSGIYPVEYPDYFETAGGEAALVYDNGKVAAVASARDKMRTILMGFPLETIVDEGTKKNLLDLCLSWLMPDHTPDDFDGDGLPDEWEEQYGTDPLRPSADEDPDGDGYTNLQEFEQGSDPRHPDNVVEEETGEATDGGENAAADGGQSDDVGGEEQLHRLKIVGGCSCSYQENTPSDSGGLCLLALLWVGWLRRKAKPNRIYFRT